MEQQPAAEVIHAMQITGRTQDRGMRLHYSWRLVVNSETDWSSPRLDLGQISFCLSFSFFFPSPHSLTLFLAVFVLLYIYHVQSSASVFCCGFLSPASHCVGVFFLFLSIHILCSFCGVKRLKGRQRSDRQPDDSVYLRSRVRHMLTPHGKKFSDAN